jgi:uncharacterized protein
MGIYIPARPVGLLTQLFRYPVYAVMDAFQSPTSHVLHERLKGAARLCEYAIAKKCLRQGANPNITAENGMPLIVFAASHAQAPLLRALLDAGADVNAMSRHGWTPLRAAADNGDESTTRLLLDNGADVNARAPDSQTALFDAAEAGHTRVVRLLLDRGADPTLTLYGRTAQDVAHDKNHDDIERLLAAATPPPAAQSPATIAVAGATPSFNRATGSGIVTSQSISVNRPLVLKSGAAAMP